MSSVAAIGPPSITRDHPTPLLQLPETDHFRSELILQRDEKHQLKMAFVSNPTYLLAPNWSFPIDGPITIGNIIGDPFRPHRTLSKPAPDGPAPVTITTLEKNWHLELDRTRTVNLAVWTKLFSRSEVDISAHRNKSNAVSFTMSQLQTVYLKYEPSAVEIAARAKEHRVAAVLNSRRWGRRGPVYMVSGLKIAKGFVLERSVSLDKGVRSNVGGEVAPEVSVGVGVEVGGEMRRAEGFEAEQDIVFAYQLLSIRRKGSAGDDGEFEVEEWKSDAALLTDNIEEKDELGGEDTEPELEVGWVGLEELIGAQGDVESTVNSLDEDQFAWLFECE